MTSPYPATIINLSSGQLLFNDPTESPAWDPASLGLNPPVFPSTSLAIGVQGTVADRNLESITFTNIFKYQSYENSTTLTNLQKTLVVNKQGVVTYEDPKVGVVSTVAAAFNANVSTFLNSTIGGANIYDTTYGTPDTLTNALGKLDGWIANAFLLQPPAVTLVNADNTSLYGGVRWENPRVYNILDKSAPYVSGIVFIIGTPGSGNVFSFEMNDCTFFPYKSFRNGISPYFNPLVQLRIFTDYFLQSADQLYTKSVMKTKCIQIIEESGNAILPDTGKVFAIDYTNRTDTFTTISLYLPNLANTYPKGSPVPIQIAYINKTEGDVNIAYSSTVTNVLGAPSALTLVTPLSSEVSSLRIRVNRPNYADSLGLVSTPFFSTYSLQYTLQTLATAHSGGIGYRYGCNSPTVIPDILSNYVNSTMTQDFIYALSTQNLALTGYPVGNPVIPGIVWSTVGYATNSAHLMGVTTAGPIMSTLFPTSIVPPINSCILSNVAYSQTRYKDAGFLKYLSYQNGWNTGYNVSTDVFYLSTPTTLAYQVNSTIQLNDSSFPGDRSGVTVYNQYTNIDQNTFSAVSLQLSTYQDDYPLNTYLSTNTGMNDSLAVNIRDTYTASTFQKYFYGAHIDGNQYISTISTSPQCLQLYIVNGRIDNYNDPINLNNTQSTPCYLFETEPSSSPSTLNVAYRNTCLSTTKVSGIVTPSLTSKFLFDIVANNFAHIYSAPEFAHAYIAQRSIANNTTACGPTHVYSTGVIVYDNTTNTEITSLPFPVSTTMRISSCGVGVYSTIYQNPIEPSFIDILATLTPANPEGLVSTFVSTLTSSIFIDTVSLTKYSTFTNIKSTNGVRVVSLLPRTGIGASATDIYDGVDLYGQHGIGLNVNMDPYFIVGANSNIVFSPSILYQHASSISSIYTDNYSRELLYTNGKYIHPAGYTFNVFDGKFIGVPDAVYPDFTYDLIYDDNNGFRYATFAFESQQFPTPTNLQYLKVKFIKPSIVSTISENYFTNSWFPDTPTVPYLMSTMKIRMHTKTYASYTDAVYKTMSTAWLDGFQLVDDNIYDDQIYNTAACVAVSTINSNVEYTVQLDRRAYTKLCSVVRVGISRDGGLYAGDFPYPITFEAIETSYSDNI